jgi:conjugal transfer/type IV secretion protein DotA/TraY
MMDFFTPVSGDQSMIYLANIFGSMGGILPSSGTLSILGAMFATFNSVALVIGALIIAYMTIVGVMMTAHEGEFMKKWNSLWTPLRAVFGIAALVPTSSGFCSIQILMMWVIVQGVGAADSIWNTALTYLSVFSSPYAQVSMQNPQVGPALGTLLPIFVCEASAYSQNAPLVTYSPPAGGYYCYSNPTNPWCQNPLPATLSTAACSSSASPPQCTTSFGPSNAPCGTLTFCDQAALCSGGASGLVGCAACQAQIQVLEQQIIPLMRQIASYFVSADYQYQNYYLNGNSIANGEVTQLFPPPTWLAQYCEANNYTGTQCAGPMTDSVTGNTTESPLPNPNVGSANASTSNDTTVVDNLYWPYVIKPQYTQAGSNGGTNNSNFLTTIASQYSTSIQAGISNYITQLSSSNPAGVISSALSAAQQTGWVYAGAYYYTIAQDNGANVQGSWPAFAATINDPAVANPANALTSTRNNVEAAQELVNQINGVSSGIAGAAGSTMALGTQVIQQSLASATEPGVSNALIAFAQSGYALLTSAQLFFVAVFGLVLFVGLPAGINVFALGTGMINPEFAAASPIFMWLIPMFMFTMGVMISMGGLMGVYIPLIPFMMFTFGVVGWFTATLEAVAAGPLVALGILAPGGHHEILGKAEPALMLLFNLFLRPTLMIFGLVAAMLLANTVVVPMINYLFWNVAVVQIGQAAIGSGGALEASPLESTIFLVAYVTMVLAALNKCFDAIHIIPERVITWIGGQAVSYGEGEAMGEVKSGVQQGGTGAARGAMEGAVTGTGAAIEGSRKVGDARKQHAAIQASKVSGPVGPEAGGFGPVNNPNRGGGEGGEGDDQAEG